MTDESPISTELTAMQREVNGAGAAKNRCLRVSSWEWLTEIWKDSRGEERLKFKVHPGKNQLSCLLEHLTWKWRYAQLGAKSCNK